MGNLSPGHPIWKIIPSANRSPLLELSEKQLLQAPNADAIVLHDAAVAHMLHPGTTITFQGDADTVFGSYHYVNPITECQYRVL